MKHLERDLDRLKREILAMGAQVEEAIDRSVAALLERDRDLAARVMDGDRALDEREVEIEESCLKVLALHQPVATDLRFIVTVLKVNNDLERMGDLAVNIAERADFLAAHPALEVGFDFREMTEKSREMVRESLDALVRLDTELAHKVGRDDAIVDAMNRDLFAVLQEMMARNPAHVARAVHTLSVSRHLERIADLATNIAEDVIFLVEGEIVRHQAERYEEPPPAERGP